MVISIPKNNHTSRLQTSAALCLLLFGLFTLRSTGAERAVRTLPANSSGEEIQQALDGLVDGGDVVLPPGTWLIHKPIILQNDHLTLRGSGPATILLLADDANCPVVILGAPTKAARQTVTDLHLADLVIDGNRQHQQVEFWRAASDGSVLNNNGIDIWAVTDAAVERVVCCRCRSGGMVTAETRRLNVRDFTAFDNEFDGLACYFTEESTFTSLRLHDNLAAGISLDLAFNHNVIAQALLTGNDLGIFMRDSRDNVFQALTVDKSRHHGVFMAQTAENTPKGWQLTPGTECTGNIFENPVITNSGGYAILINNASCTNNIVSDAQFANNLRGGLFQEGGEPVPALTVAVP